MQSLPIDSCQGFRFKEAEKMQVPGTGTPRPEVEINVPIVTTLLEEQHSDLAHLPILTLDAGWDKNIRVCLIEYQQCLV